MSPEVIKHILNLALVSLQGGSLSGQIDGECGMVEFAEDLALDFGLRDAG